LDPAVATAVATHPVATATATRGVGVHAATGRSKGGGIAAAGSNVLGSGGTAVVVGRPTSDLAAVVAGVVSVVAVVAAVVVAGACNVGRRVFWGRRLPVREEGFLLKDLG